MRIDRGAVQTAVEEMDGGYQLEDVLREQYRGKGEQESGFALTFRTDKEIQEFFVQLALFDADVATQLVRASKHDQMGTGYITYFPGWELMFV